jgi:hypothetical protein
MRENVQHRDTEAQRTPRSGKHIFSFLRITKTLWRALESQSFLRVSVPLW